MEASKTRIDGVQPDANTPKEDPPLNVSSIFQDVREDKKVIHLSPGLENENSIQVLGELSNLMDAVNQPADGAEEQSMQLLNETNYQPTNNVPAIDETCNVLKVSVSEANGMDVAYVSQEITVQSIPVPEEQDLNPDDKKYQDAQLIVQAFQHAMEVTDLTVKRLPKRDTPSQNVLEVSQISSSLYVSNCTTCGGYVRLTTEQARVVQEVVAAYMRIICSNCEKLGHDVSQLQKSVAIDLKPACDFTCEKCGYAIKLTNDQVQLVEQNGAENVIILCILCTTKDQDTGADPEPNSGTTDSNQEKCNICHSSIVATNWQNVTSANPSCAECQAKGEEAMGVDNINPHHDAFISNCTMCHKELLFAQQPPRKVRVLCDYCKNKKVSRTKPPPVESSFKPVETLALMYKCNRCLCDVQISAEQYELLHTPGLSGAHIICLSCHAKETSKPAGTKKPRLAAKTYECDICQRGMGTDFNPEEGDDIICNTCRRAEEKEENKRNIAFGKRRRSNTKNPQQRPINHMCYMCNKTVRLSRSQIQKLTEKGSSVRVKCSACNRKTEEELGKTMEIINTEEETVDYRCEICSISFEHRFDDFTEHFFKFHVPESDTDSTSRETYKSKEPLMHCPICDAGFFYGRYLKLHMNTHKPKVIQRFRVPRKPCPICCIMMDRVQMYEHYKNFHKIDFVKMHYTFASGEELREWKTTQELSTNTKFVAANPRAKVVRSHSDLRCQYAVKKEDESTGKYPTVFCPAKMVINEKPSGHYDVDYVKTHVGHGDLSNLPEEAHHLIIEMLKGGHTVEEIIEELSKHCSDPESEDLLRCISVLKSINLIVVRNELGLNPILGTNSNSYASTDYESIESEVTDTDQEGSIMKFVDLPESLSWLTKESAANAKFTEDGKSQNEASITIQDIAGQYRLDIHLPLAAKKFEILRRLSEVLNKCTCEEHLEIVDSYLNLCEQATNELPSGRPVVVDEDSNRVMRRTSK